MKEVVFDLQEFKSTVTLSNSLASQLGNLRIFPDYAVNNLVCELTRSIPCIAKEHFKVIYPKTWWDAFKNRWFPSWLIKKFPVVYTLFEIDAKQLYEEMELPPQCGDGKVRLFVTEKEDCKYWKK